MSTMINRIYCTYFLKHQPLHIRFLKKYRWSQRSKWPANFYNSFNLWEYDPDQGVLSTPHLLEAAPGDASSQSGPTGLALAWLVNWKKDGGAMKEVEKKDVCVFLWRFFFLWWICGSLANLSWMWVTLVMNSLVWTFWDAALVRERMRKAWWLSLFPSLQTFSFLPVLTHSDRQSRVFPCASHLYPPSVAETTEWVATKDHDGNTLSQNASQIITGWRLNKYFVVNLLPRNLRKWFQIWRAYFSQMVWWNHQLG